MAIVMLLLAAGVLGLLAGMAAGGRPKNLASLRLRWPLLVVAALVVKQAGMLPPLSRSPLVPVAYVLAMLALAAWTCWHGPLLPGLWLVALGLGTNLAVVVLNAGHMPVSPDLAGHGPPALRLHGVAGQYVLFGAATRLPWLGDWISVPGALGSIFREAYSPGDLVIAAGMALAGLQAAKKRTLERKVADAASDPTC